MKKIVSAVLGLIGILIVAFGIILKMKKNYSVSIIGGADGPTSIYLAGKIGSDASLSMIAAGIVIVVIAGIVILKHKR